MILSVSLLAAPSRAGKGPFRITHVNAGEKCSVVGRGKSIKPSSNPAFTQPPGTGASPNQVSRFGSSDNNVELNVPWITWIQVTGTNRFDIPAAWALLSGSRIDIGFESGSDPARQWPFRSPSTTFRSTNTNRQHIRPEEVRTGRTWSRGIVAYEYKID